MSLTTDSEGYRLYVRMASRSLHHAQCSERACVPKLQEDLRHNPPPFPTGSSGVTTQHTQNTTHTEHVKAERPVLSSTRAQHTPNETQYTVVQSPSRQQTLLLSPSNNSSQVHVTTDQCRRLTEERQSLLSPTAQLV